MQCLKENGVAVLKNVINEIDLKNLLGNYNYIHNNFINSKKYMNQKLYKYYTHFDRERYTYKKYYTSQTYNSIELSKGKYDISLNKKININKFIDNLIDSLFKHDKKVIYGILTSSSQSKNGEWHRDVVNIDGEADANGNYDDKNMVHNMNPFYYTILIPLVNIGNFNGSTEFIEKSHKLCYDELEIKSGRQFEVNAGDIIIFDGRIFHRSRENLSNEERPIIYIVVHKSWYNDI